MEARFEELWKLYERLAATEYLAPASPIEIVQSQSQVLDLGIRLAQAQAFYERNQLGVA